VGAFREIVTTPGHVFYDRLNAVLNAEKFDQRIEVICRKYYKSSSGRPSRRERISGCCCWDTSRASIRSGAWRGGRRTA
jgi:hypothetical protein